MTITPDPQVADVRTGFADRLRRATSAAHETAAGGTFVTDLVEGSLDRSHYARMMGQLWFVYDELEALSFAMADHPVAGAFVLGELTRLPSLEADLKLLVGAGWRDELDPIDATTAYCERIRAASGSPELFVAHHYTRYLGDLSGGQYIGAAVRRVYGFEVGAPGASFFNFAGILDTVMFKDAYRARLDALPFGTDSQQRLLDEVTVAYHLNAAVTSELDTVRQ